MQLQKTHKRIVPCTYEHLNKGEKEPSSRAFSQMPHSDRTTERSAVSRGFRTLLHCVCCVRARVDVSHTRMHTQSTLLQVYEISVDTSDFVYAKVSGIHSNLSFQFASVFQMAESSKTVHLLP